MIFIHALLYTTDVISMLDILMAFGFSDIHEPTNNYTYGVSNCLCKTPSNVIEFFSGKICANSSQMKPLDKVKKNGK
jgi:hypothetical protein